MTGSPLGLIGPALVLALFAWAIPRLLARVMPEGIRALLAIGFLGGVIMMLVAGAVFVGLYRLQGLPIAALAEAGIGRAVAHFARLAMFSGIIWVPILVLSVAGLPKTWTKETW